MPRAAGDGDTYELRIVNVVGHPVGPPSHLPSVTTILNSLPKYLQWWGFKLGLDAARSDVVSQLPNLKTMDLEVLYEQAKKFGREDKITTPSNSLKRAGKRGADIHDIAEQFFVDGTIPRKDEVPEEYHGYMRALAGFVATIPAFEVVLTESPVYSLKHRYAGTLDLLVRHAVPSGFESDGSYQLFDFKTGKDIYESALLQMTAYEHALRELGIIEEGAAVTATAVNLRASGEFVTRDSKCSLDDFLNVKKVYELLKRLEEEKEQEKIDAKV